jgi:hypothetical protein
LLRDSWILGTGRSRTLRRASRGASRRRSTLRPDKPQQNSRSDARPDSLESLESRLQPDGKIAHRPTRLVTKNAAVVLRRPLISFLYVTLELPQAALDTLVYGTRKALPAQQSRRLTVATDRESIPEPAGGHTVRYTVRCPYGVEHERDSDITCGGHPDRDGRAVHRSQS